MKKLLILVFLAVIFSGCKKNEIIIINGSIRNGTGEYLKINKIDVNNIEPVDSVKVSKSGTFRFRVKSRETDFYQVGYSAVNFISLLATPGERITLAFNDSVLYNDYTVEGSEGCGLVKELDDRLLITRKKLDSLSAVYEKASTEPGFETIKPGLEEQIISVVREQRQFNIKFVVNHISSLASIKALYQKLNDQTYVLYETRDLQYLKIVADSLKVHYPDSRHTIALINTFEEGMRELTAKKLNMMMDTLPEAKLDAVLKDINGRTIALSSLKGRYVLLTFWSAGSRDCITENLQLKEYYRIYNKRGFEIYQISLDSDESVWKSAVRFDELPWISTREEDPGNQKSAVLFNVRNVPANFLFDPMGKIIASNLHGKALQLKLAQLFPN